MSCITSMIPTSKVVYGNVNQEPIYRKVLLQYSLKKKISQGRNMALLVNSFESFHPCLLYRISCILYLISVIWNTRIYVSGFPDGSDGKESACNAGDAGSILGSGRSSGGGLGNPLQYSCLENPMDRGSWQATVHAAAKSWTELSD